jgi:RNA polymerase sigma-70 factor (ECF subfamily)
MRTYPDAATIRPTHTWLRDHPLMPANEDTDAESWSAHLREIAVSHSKERFSELFGYFAPRLKSYFMRLGQKAEMAEDLAQETMLTVWRKADLFDPSRASAATWIFTVARNLRIDRLRREKNPADAAEFYEFAPEPTPGETTLLAERERRARTALEALSREQREVIRLAFFEERSHAEISEALRIPLGTVKSRVRLALEKMKGLVEDLR